MIYRILKTDSIFKLLCQKHDIKHEGLGFIELIIEDNYVSEPEIVLVQREDYSDAKLMARYILNVANLKNSLHFAIYYSNAVCYTEESGNKLSVGELSKALDTLHDVGLVAIASREVYISSIKQLKEFING